VILDAVQAMRDRKEAAAQELAKRTLVAKRRQLVSDPNSPVAGNPKGDVTIVEFFDYRCGYCKATLPVIQRILKEDSDVRLVFKEFPILSKESGVAARAALAAEKQGKYFEFHNALMSARGSFSDNQIMDIAAEVGLDLDQLAEDMESPEIDATLDANKALARDLQITGTPTFVIGGDIHPGALDINMLRDLIERQRTG
jgi:protein-disulfide isomerase